MSLSGNCSNFVIATLREELCFEMTSVREQLYLEMTSVRELHCFEMTSARELFILAELLSGNSCILR